MSEWKEVKLGEVSEVTSSKRIFYSDYVSEGIPFWRSKEIIEKFNRKKISTDLYITSEKYFEIKNRFGVPLPNDILLTSVGTLGIPYLVEDKEQFYFKDGNLTWIRNIDEKRLSPHYLYKWLASQQGRDSLREITIGSTQEALTIIGLKNLNLFLPPLLEQKAIASVLSSLDDKIDLLHRQNKTLEAMAETLFRQWFVEEAQEDWEEVTIGDFVELNRASIDKNYPYQAIEYLDTGSLTEGKIESFQSFALDDAPSRAKRLVQHNDILISTVRPDQKHYGIIKNPIENLVVSTGFCVLTCTKIDPHFIYLLLTNDEMTDYLHTIAEGSTSTYPSLKPSDIGSIAFQLPPHGKLEEFSVISQNSWEKIEKNHIQIRTLETLRDTLLPKLMSGEVRVTV